MNAKRTKHKAGKRKIKAGMSKVAVINQSEVTANASTRDSEREIGPLTATAAARIIHSPAANGAAITGSYQQGFADMAEKYKVDFLELYEDLSIQIGHVEKGDLSRAEAMLISQAHALQSIFLHYALVGKSQGNLGRAQMAMGMAFKAQAQCRATLQTLVEVKYPRHTSFVKQQNVAAVQQVNNGPAPSEASRAREDLPEMANELLEGDHHERMESSAAGTPSPVNSAVAAVGKINRTTYPRGEETSKAKLPEARVAIRERTCTEETSERARKLATAH